MLVPSAVAAPAATTATSAPAAVASWRFCTNCVDSAGDLSRYGYVGLNAWNQDRISGLKAANPGVKALVYKDMASTRSYSCGGLVPAGIDYCWAQANRPEWFTLDAAGDRIEWSGYSGVWQMDVGAAAYQDQWAENVIAELRSNGWDGVVIDNANVDESGYLGGRAMQEYPTQPAYQSATRSFLANVCPKVIGAGFLCLPNIQAHPVHAGPALWADWVQFTSGGVREYWMKWGVDGGGQFGDGGWDDLQSVFRTVQGVGKIFLPVTYAPPSDARSMRWARASFLLTWNGGASALVFAPTPEAQDPWSPEWTTDVGQPAGPATSSGPIWRRSFSEGLVIVNRSSSPATVELGGTYAVPGGATVTSASIEPYGGLVLRAAPAPAAPSATPPAAAPTAAPAAPPADAPQAPPAAAAPPASGTTSVPAEEPKTEPAVVERLVLAARHIRKSRVRTFLVNGRVVASGEVGTLTVRLLRSVGRTWRTIDWVRPGPNGRFTVPVRIRSKTGRVRIRAVVHYRGGLERSRVLILAARGR